MTKVRLGFSSGLGERGAEVDLKKGLADALIESGRATKVSTKRSSKTADEATNKEGE